MATVIDKDFFLQLAAIARRESLPYFRQPVTVANKDKDRFDPVTVADIKTEQGLRAHIAAKFPDHAIYGEEHGCAGAESDTMWVIDPIDGTRAFISGMPVWGTLVGLLHKGRAVAGMMAQPFTRELFFANAEGSFYHRDGQALQRLAVRQTTDLAAATLFSTAPSLFDENTGPAFSRLEQAVQMTRYGTDCYAFAMLAAGCVDLVVEVGLKPHDIVALIPIIEQAGGMITQWNGQPAEQGGNIIAAANPQLYASALQKLGVK